MRISVALLAADGRWPFRRPTLSTRRTSTIARPASRPRRSPPAAASSTTRVAPPPSAPTRRIGGGWRARRLATRQRDRGFRQGHRPRSPTGGGLVQPRRDLSGAYEPERAIADFSEAIKLDPKLVIAYDRRGMSYGYTGDPKQRAGGLRHGDRNRSELRRCLLAPRPDLRGRRRHRPRPRRLRQADRDRPERSARPFRPGQRLSRQARLPARHRRMRRSAPHRSEPYRRPRHPRQRQPRGRPARSGHRRLQRSDQAQPGLCPRLS